jgi:integrase
MAKVFLTDRYIQSRSRVPASGRTDYRDAMVPGMALRVTSTGHRSFVLIARFPLHPKHPTRRALGNYGELTLEEAREKCRRWLALIRRGIDPSVDEARQQAAAQRRQINSFRHVAEQFLDRHASGLAKGEEIRRAFESEFMPKWAARPVTEIEPMEVAAAIRAIADRAPAHAHNILGYLRRLFGWAIGQHAFGLERSPVERLKPADLIGKRVVRDRVLTDSELRAVWEAAAVIGYPYGAIVQALILTGQRLKEISALSWPEIDLEKRLITIPAKRMKSRAAHEISIGADTMALLRSLPRFSGGGDFLFSANNGVRPYVAFSTGKARLDRLSGVAGFVVHDLRRTMRTHLSALPIEDRVREAMIAHASPELHRIYDQHRYTQEKARGFQLWEARLARILAPASGAVVAFAAKPITHR